MSVVRNSGSPRTVDGAGNTNFQDHSQLGRAKTEESRVSIQCDPQPGRAPGGDTCIRNRRDSDSHLARMEYAA